MRTEQELSDALAVVRLVHLQVQSIPLQKLGSEDQLIVKRDKMWTEEQIKILEWVQGSNNRFEDAIQAWKKQKGWK